MRKHIFTLMALAAALCACSKEQIIESEITGPVVEPSAPLVFTATMEGPGSKATLADKTLNWEVGEQIIVNGFDYTAKSAGTSSEFNVIGGSRTQEVRPIFVSGSPTTNNVSQSPKELVDDAGTRTKWCDNIVDENGLYIIVATKSACKLNSIKLWNGGDTHSRPGRRWKEIQVSGSSSANGTWRTIYSNNNLNLSDGNSELAGEIVINADREYQFYRIDVFSAVEGNMIQMSDMKFVITQGSDKYTAYFPTNLISGYKTVLPATFNETWVNGKFNMPMYAQSSTTNLNFKNLCAVLKIVVKDDSIESVKSIKVSSANKATSGFFSVNNNTAVLEEPDAIENAITVTYANAVATTAEGVVFYVAIPAQTYRELKVDLSSNGTDYIKSMKTKVGTDIEVQRNKIYQITVSPRQTEDYTLSIVDIDINDFTQTF